MAVHALELMELLVLVVACILLHSSNSFTHLCTRASLSHGCGAPADLSSTVATKSRLAAHEQSDGHGPEAGGCPGNGMAHSGLHCVLDLLRSFS